MRILTFFLVLLFLFPVAAAKADVYVWKDPESGMTMSYPDTWQKVSNQDPDTVITVLAPTASDEAMCKVRVSPDARYVIFPPRYSSAVQKVAYSSDFWKEYLYGQYTDVMIHQVKDQAGLGRGFASYMLSTYTTQGEDAALKTSIGFATLYYDNAYVLECSALAGAFENWLGMFQSIAKSVDFEKAHHELVIGNFEDFLN